jgi:RNA polymerase primary sigma factor
MKMPLNRVGTIYRVGKVIDKLEQKLKRNPTHQEIAKYLKIDESDVNEAFAVGGTHSSLDTPIEKEGGNLLDLMPDIHTKEPDAEIDGYFLNNKINGLLNTLKKREAKVIRLYFGIDCEKSHTLDEIALKYGLTRERIRQIKERAIMRLKHPSRNFKLKKYY